MHREAHAETMEGKGRTGGDSGHVSLSHAVFCCFRNESHFIFLCLSSAGETNATAGIRGGFSEIANEYFLSIHIMLFDNNYRM